MSLMTTMEKRSDKRTLDHSSTKSMKIDLHSIFRYLTDDEKLLCVVIDNTQKVAEKKAEKKGENIMKSAIIGFIPLSPGQLQTSESFPIDFQRFFTPDHSRMGVKNIMNKDLSDINISFLNSLNMLIRPKLMKDFIQNPTLNVIKEVEDLKEFIKHKLACNAQIDKVVKNTIKVRNANNKFIHDLAEGKISQELIQYIVNLFEINLFIFDFLNNTITFYWAHGKIYPHLNMFKDIHLMSFSYGNFEPIVYMADGKPPPTYTNFLYGDILLNPEIIFFKPIKVGIQTVHKIFDLKLPADQLVKIVQKYYETE